MHLSHGRIYLHVFSSSKFFKSTEFFRCYSTSFEVWNFLKTCFWIAFNVFVIFHKLPYSQPNLFLFAFDANFLRYGFFFDKWVSVLKAEGLYAVIYVFHCNYFLKEKKHKTNDHINQKNVRLSSQLVPLKIQSRDFVKNQQPQDFCLL